jgi:hypothetical protein
MKNKKTLYIFATASVSAIFIIIAGMFLFSCGGNLNTQVCMAQESNSSDGTDSNLNGESSTQQGTQLQPQVQQSKDAPQGGTQQQDQMQPQNQQQPQDQSQNKPQNQDQYQPQNTSDGTSGGQSPDANCFGEGNDNCRQNALKADYRDIDRMIDEIVRMQKQNTNTGINYQSLIDTLKSLRSDLDNISSQEDVDGVRTKIWAVRDELDSYRIKDEIVRMEDDITRDKKQHEQDKKFLENIKKSVSGDWDDKIDEQIERMSDMENLQQKMIDAMNAGESMESINDIRSELNDIKSAYGEFWNEFQEIKNETFTAQIFDEVENSINAFLKDEYPKLSGDLKTKADELVKVATQLVKEGRAAQESGDTKKVEKIKSRLMELNKKAESFLGKPDLQFEEMGFSEGFDKNFQELSGDMSYDKQMKVVKQILTANPDIMQEVLLSDSKLAEQTLRIFDRIPTENQNEYLELKTELSQLYEEIYAKNSGISAYKNDILGYNYYGTAQEDLIAYLKEVSEGTMTLEELSSKFNTMKTESKDGKFNAGIISFSDYDDSDWYYQPVEQMSGFLQGKKGDDGNYKFAGGDQITFAETLKIVLEKFGKGQSTEETTYGNAKNHWAKGYYAQAEKLGLTLLDPDHYITRGEMARLIVEVSIGDPASHSTSSFSDLNTSNPYFNYLETMHDYGVINGDSVQSDMPTVRPDATINRAEAAKVIDYAYENMQSNLIESSDFNALLQGI